MTDEERIESGPEPTGEVSPKTPSGPPLGSEINSDSE
jgi:hypothetical protein